MKRNKLRDRWKIDDSQALQAPSIPACNHVLNLMRCECANMRAQIQRGCQRGFEAAALQPVGAGSKELEVGTSQSTTFIESSPSSDNDSQVNWREREADDTGALAAAKSHSISSAAMMMCAKLSERQMRHTWQTLLSPNLLGCSVNLFRLVFSKLDEQFGQR